MKIDFYRQRIWTCGWTGKSGLTFEEAMLSEKEADAEISQIDPILQKGILKLVQNSMRIV